MDIPNVKQVAVGRDRPLTSNVGTLSTTEAATILGCTRQNVADLYKRGQLAGPPRQPRSPVRLYQASIEAYRNERAHRAQARPQVSSTPDKQEADQTVRQLRSQVEQLQALVEALLKADHERSLRLADLNALHTATDESELQQLDALIDSHHTAVKQLEVLKEQHLNARMRWTLLHEITSASQVT